MQAMVDNSYTSELTLFYRSISKIAEQMLIFNYIVLLELIL